MEKSDGLWAYDPNEPVSDEARRVYGLILPLFHEYVLGELLDQHVEGRRRDAVREDIRTRLDRLIDEARFCVGTGVPDPVGTWWIERRRHPFEVRDSDLRRRRRKLPHPTELLQEFTREHGVLKGLLPRRGRGQPIPERSFQILQELRPELGWHDVADSLDQTPAEVAHRILSDKYGTSPRRVKTVLKQARRELRG